MSEIYIIEVNRSYGNYRDKEVMSQFFTTEEDAKKYLINKYGDWIDKDKLYIYYNGLWRYKIKDESGINFSIKKLKAA